MNTLFGQGSQFTPGRYQGRAQREQPSTQQHVRVQHQTRRECPVTPSRRLHLPCLPSRSVGAPPRTGLRHRPFCRRNKVYTPQRRNAVHPWVPSLGLFRAPRRRIDLLCRARARRCLYDVLRLFPRWLGEHHRERRAQALLDLHVPRLVPARREPVSGKRRGEGQEVASGAAEVHGLFLELAVHGLGQPG